MAPSTFTAEVLTPEGEVFSGEVERISTRTTLGLIGILARHEEVLATLDPTELRLYRPGGEVVRYAQAEGYLQFAANHALILVQEAVEPGRLDHAALEGRAREARSAVEQAPEGSEQRARAERDLLRAQAFLKVEA